ncbi:30S ribosomal protein S3 [Thiomicrorhabdus sp. ZW0627]|uniref:30S ribosomal protein S3 n=1 Tax=Thiomicrorhabdus sp. ZW0627 TaxID=3039774 RepID=UPI0024367811|nr:30S ribosomal protein S3 [Thiomicrorhabdus sp. ZW0627]MDG6774863.1 30S ribosomal protein S3 [Thiomicrorhabdus sp. ZW0627]
MGQKVHPVGIRLGITKDWNARWYADSKNYADFLVSDVEIRNELNEKLKHASVSKLNIERVANGIRVTVHTARPGVVIGKKGEDIEKLKQSLVKKTGMPVNINIEEIKKPELDAKLVAESIAQQLEKRIQFRRAMKRAVGNAMRLGAEGIKVTVSGRLNGADIARAEWYREGRVPLHTFRADIDYATFEADTTYGKIGVKVWIFKGEKLGKLALDDNKQSKGKKGRK